MSPASDSAWRIAATAASEIVISGGVRSGSAHAEHAVQFARIEHRLHDVGAADSSRSTYSCGIVGQLPNSLMPWRISSSASTSTVA